MTVGSAAGADQPATGPGEPTTGHAHGHGHGHGEPRHIWRIVAIAAVLSVVGDLLYWFLLAPHVPPGAMTSAAQENQFDFNILFLVALPVVFAVWTYMAYAIIMWRSTRKGVPESVGGPQARASLGVQVGWIVSTTVLVFGLFIFGTVELITNAGSGGGEGPNPIWTPTSASILPVQVIAQQWKFTYRYPTFGGFETSDLVLPNNTTIEFNVTSLDVIHSFWAYQLSIKADANPQLNNVAYTTTRQTGSVTVRCNELCGLWHGAMFDYGSVVSKASFYAWARATEKANAANTANLPPYALTYVPDANGADGAYYPDNVDPYSSSEVYGAVPKGAHRPGKPTSTG